MKAVFAQQMPRQARAGLDEVGVVECGGYGYRHGSILQCAIVERSMPVSAGYLCFRVAHSTFCDRESPSNVL